MKRNRHTIKVWLTLAVSAASLAFASSASAMLNAADAVGPRGTRPVPPVVTSGGFNWAALAIGVAVALAVALIAIGLAHFARSRSRLAASH